MTPERARFDLVILGSGSTAFAAALRAQEMGKTAVVTEERESDSGKSLSVRDAPRPRALIRLALAARSPAFMAVPSTPLRRAIARCVCSAPVRELNRPPWPGGTDAQTPPRDLLDKGFRTLASGVYCPQALAADRQVGTGGDDHARGAPRPRSAGFRRPRRSHRAGGGPLGSDRGPPGRRGGAWTDAPPQGRPIRQSRAALRGASRDG